MEITTKDKNLQEFVTDDAKALKKLGQKRAKLFRKRIAQLQQADSLEELRNAIGHFHELIDNRKGQWACDLDQPYRLIFEPKEKPIPTDPNGRYTWIEIKAVTYRGGKLSRQITYNYHIMAQGISLRLFCSNQ